MPNIPATWRATQTVNAITAGIQSRPRITQLTNGYMVVVWQTSDAGGTAFVGRLLDPAGNPLGDELFRQYVTPDDNYTFPDVVAGLNGTFVTSYMNRISGTLFLNTWNSDGTGVGNGSAIDTSTTSQPHIANPTMAWSNANTVLTVYELLSPTGSTVVGRISTPGSGGSGPRLTLLDFAGGVVDPAVVANRLNGAFMIAGTNMQPGDSQIVLRVINPTTGATLSGPFAVNGTGTNGRADDQASLSQAGSGFILAFRSTSGGDSNIEFRLLGGDGSENFAGSISVGASDKFANPNVILLPDFSFMIIYDDEVTHTQHAAHYYGPGTLFPGTLIGTYAYAPTGSDTDAVALADGRFATVWTDAATGEISLQILDTRDAPNAAGSDGVVAGTVGDDVIAGGARFTAGGAGNDEIGFAYAASALPTADGGEGIDTLVFASQTNNITVDLATGLTRFEWQSGQNVFQTRQYATNFENIRYAGTATVEAYGTSGANVIITGSGSDKLDGGAGADRLEGGAGNDTYVIDNAGDVVVELAGQGFDAVYSLVSFALTAGSQVEWLSAFANFADTPINLTGSDLGQFVMGNAGANVLDGKGGADFMQGFGGNDTYYVDNLGDAPIEIVGGGFDTVYSAINYLLPTAREIEWFSAIDNGSAQAIDLIGNEFAQTLLGTNGVNALDGSGGADTMYGYGGNDIYFADNAGDRAVEAANGGFDAVYARASFALEAGSEVEWLSAAQAGDTAALNLTGNAIGQYLFGNAGANVLNGGGGNDIITGYGGADTFQFTTALGATNVDTLADFQAGIDKIALDDAIFTQIGGLGALSASAFVSGSAATAAGHRIVYNAATGQLFYDADGSGAGAAVHFATLQGNPMLSASDFQVI